MSDQSPHPEPSSEPPRKGLTSRRTVLGAMGAGAIVVGAPTAVSAARNRGERGRGPTRGANGNSAAANNGLDRFGRMFNDHPPFVEPDDELRTQLAALGAPGGILDANDPLEHGPVRLITEPELSPDNPDNPGQTAGSTFMGQFLDHDVTNDAGSPLGRATSLRRSTNLRSARLDLDGVYGGGPTETRELYTDDDPFRFRVESGGLFEDLPRDADGIAIVGDSRNDENLMIAGIQVAFLKFHNAVLERVRASGTQDEMAFIEARRLVRWHYQWLVLEQFLPEYVGQEMVDDILTNGRRFYTPNQAQIPVEFQTSAYRFGHSLIRPSYRANLAGDEGEPFFGFVFDNSQEGAADPDDLRGGVRGARRFIGWQTFFDFGDGEVKPNKLIDTKLSTPLFQLPMGTISTSRGEPIGPASLATRNLLRHITWGIPSGEALAEEMNAERLGAPDLSDIAEVAPRVSGNTPLWLYVLREAELMADGQHLGPVGGRIVAEVFIGLLQLDPESYLSAEPGWTPTLPTRTGQGEFKMADLLAVAEVDPDSRGQ